MLTRSLLFCLAVLVFGLSFGATAFAAPNSGEGQTTHAEKIKKHVAKLGTDRKVEVNLNDGTKLKGRISDIKQDSFVATNKKTGAQVEVQYSQAKHVRRETLSTPIAVAIGAGILTAVRVLDLLLAWGVSEYPRAFRTTSESIFRRKP